MFSFKKNKTTESKEDSETTDKPKLPTITVILVVFALLANGAWIFWSYDNLVVTKQAQKIEAASNIQLHKGKELIEFQLRRLNQTMQQYGQRKSVIDALAQPTGDVTPWLSSLLQALPEGSQSVLLRMDKIPEEQYPNFKFLFAELDLINKAKRNEPAFPEITGNSNSKTLALALALALLPESEQVTTPAGVVFIRVPTDYLTQAFQRKFDSAGQFQIIQTFTNTKPQPVFTVGQGRGPEVNQEINQIWSLQFKAGPGLIESAQSQPLFLYLSWIVTLVASVLAALWLAKVRKRADAKKAQLAKEGNINAIMAVDLAQEDRDLLAGEEGGRTGPQDTSGTLPLATVSRFPATVFRAYDIRGLAGKEIDSTFANHLGKALGSKIRSDHNANIFVGRDGRNSSPEIYQALINGLTSTGVEVFELGLIPSPLLHYAVAKSEDCKNGIIVTASHNSAEYNGFKITLNGMSLSQQDIETLHQAMETEDFTVGQANSQPAPINEDYIDEILADVALMGDVKLVIDAANGATSEIAPILFSEMGCEVIPLYCEVDGNFPNHDPDPSKAANLQDLINKVKEEQADLGVAFDGDGDRIFVVTESGEIITPDRLLMLFARDIVARNPGTDVVFDVKCTRQLGTLISSYGGRPIMWKTGHANMKTKIMETGALLGGEYSGHIFFKDRWYGFDDGMLAAARLLEIMSLREQGLDEIFTAFPVLPSTPEIRIPAPEDKKFSIIQNLIEKGDFQSGTVSTIDGLRIDFAKGWGLARASNTGPELTLRFEGETTDVIDQLKMLFKRELEKVDASLNLDF